MQFKEAPNNLSEIRTQKVSFNEQEITFLKRETILQRQIQSLQLELQQVDILKKQIQSLNNQIQQKDLLIQQFEFHQTNEATLQEKLRNKEHFIMDQEFEISKLTQKIEQLQKDIHYEKQNKQIAYEIKQPVKSLIQQQEKPQTIQELEKELLYKSQAILKVQEKKRKLKQEFQQKLKQLENQLKDYKNGYEKQYICGEELQQKLQKEITQKQKLEIENNTLKEQLALLDTALQQDNKNQDNDQFKYVIEIQNLRNKNLQQQQQISKLQYDLSEVNTQSAILAEKLKTYDHLKIKNDQLQGELMLLETENERLKRKNLSDMDQIEKQIIQINLKEQQIKDQKYELDLRYLNQEQVVKYTNGMKEENQQLNEEITILKAQIIDLRKQFEFVEERHEQEMRILEEKIKLQSTQVNQRIINQIPIQINSPYQIPQINRHYL